MSGKTDEPQASAARRTLRLVELLLANPNGLSPQELVGELESSRSTLFVLLNTLKKLGYVEQSEKRGRYRAGARLQAWRVSGPGQTADLSQAFYQEAERRAFSETLALVAPASGGPLVLAQVEGSQQVRAVLATGQNGPGLQAAGQVPGRSTAGRCLRQRLCPGAIWRRRSSWLCRYAATAAGRKRPCC